MKIKELIYQAPEMSEEKLLQIIDKNVPYMRKSFIQRIEELHKGKKLSQAILDEYDIIQDKKSFLTKSQREQIVGFVGLCMIKMAKNNE